MYPGSFVALRGDKPALIMSDSGFVQTFAELDAAANRFSRVLRTAGIQPGDHVAICLENHDRYLEVVWGCHYAGAVYTTCSSRLTSKELSYIIRDSEATCFITSRHQADRIADDPTSDSAVRLRLALDGAIPGYDSYEDEVARYPATPLNEERVAGTDMMYSSGTTGLPKGISRKFPFQTLSEAQPGSSPALAKFYGCTEESRYLCPAPLYHAAPLRYCMGAQALGATAVVMERFEAERYLQLVEEYRITHSQVVPTMFIRLLKLDSEVRRTYDVSSLQCLIHAAAPCPVPVKRQMIEWVGEILHEYYAGSEGNGSTRCDSQEWLAHPGTVGKPYNCTVHIVDETGQEVEPNQPGTIYFGGGPSFEYHNDPEKTRASRHPNGWSTLGDIGYVDEEGFLYLTDRQADMIISGGVNVYPQEAENVLITHPGVTDVAVFGIPNSEFGEEVKAVVQPVEMPRTEEEKTRLETELIAFTRGQLADLKCPRSVDFVTELPREPTGKLYKRLLKSRYRENAGRPA